MSHIHEWRWNEDEETAADMPFVCECGEVMDGVEALDRLNAAEKLSAENAEHWAGRIVRDLAYLPDEEPYDYPKELHDYGKIST